MPAIVEFEFEFDQVPLGFYHGVQDSIGQSLYTMNWPRQQDGEQMQAIVEFELDQVPLGF